MKPEYPWAKIDCRYFRGEKPCEYSRVACEGCPHYNPMNVRVLIIKLGAIGDVVRTTPLLRPIRASHDHVHVSWLVHPISASLLRGIPEVDSIIELNEMTYPILSAQSFDEIYCLDKDIRAASFSSLLNAKRKKGFCLSPYGTLSVHDEDAAYALRLGIDDPLHFIQNSKTYQEIIFEMCGSRFRGEPILSCLSEEERHEGRSLLERIGQGPFVGLNTGAGDGFSTKRLPEDLTAQLAREIKSRLGLTPVLLGGDLERERNVRIMDLAGEDLVHAGTHHPVRRFASIISGLSALVTVDTLALHLALAEKVPVVALFGPTASREIHLYGLGEKLVQSPWCAPCYKQSCDHHTCMKEFDVGQILDRLKVILKTTS